jgi:hypothetical protein
MTKRTARRRTFKGFMLEFPELKYASLGWRSARLETVFSSSFPQRNETPGFLPAL